MTVAELWHGVERASGAQKLHRQRYLQTLLTSLPIIPYSEQTAYYHARVWATLESSGKMIGYYDIIVAATALERGSSLATFNVKHFSQVKGIKNHQSEVEDFSNLLKVQYQFNFRPC